MRLDYYRLLDAVLDAGYPDVKSLAQDLGLSAQDLIATFDPDDPPPDLSALAGLLGRQLADLAHEPEERKRGSPKRKRNTSMAPRAVAAVQRRQALLDGGEASLAVLERRAQARLERIRLRGAELRERKRREEALRRAGLGLPPKRVYRRRVVSLR